MPGAPILVVDDAALNLKLMRMLLTHAGYEVRTAERAEDALEMLTDYQPELILADIKLPGMNGLEMARRLKSDPRTQSIRVVALTACAMTGDRERALSAGCDDYISKPIATAALTAKVRDLLAASHPPGPILIGPRASDPETSLAGAEIEALRRGFLQDGAEYCRQLLESMKSGFDAERAAWKLHQWLGSATLLGHPEISALVQKAEQILHEVPVSVPQFRAAVSELFFTFTELRDNESVPVPDYLNEAIAGKRVALVGLTAERAEVLCTVLDRVKARPRLFSTTDDPGIAAIRDCDLVLFHVRAETLSSRWLQPGGDFPAAMKLVFCGEQKDLVTLAPAVRSRAADFIVGRPDTQELLMRLAFAASRHLTVPAAPSPRAATVVELPVRARTSIASPTVFLADDDHIVHTVLRLSLQNHGMLVKSADNGITALSHIRSEPPHVAVLDINMPGMDGYEVLAAIRAEKIPTRVIMLTSLGKEKEILRAFDLGADDYVNKPFNPFEVVARLKRLLP